MRENGKPLPQRIGDLLPSVLRGARSGDVSALAEAWCRAAGPDVARRTRVVGLNRGTLVVNVESAALRYELEAWRNGEILARLREEYPASRIAAIRWVLRP